MGKQPKVRCTKCSLFYCSKSFSEHKCEQWKLNSMMVDSISGHKIWECQKCHKRARNLKDHICKQRIKRRLIQRRSPASQKRKLNDDLESKLSSIGTNLIEDEEIQERKMPSPLSLSQTLEQQQDRQLESLKINGLDNIQEVNQSEEQSLQFQHVDSVKPSLMMWKVIRHNVRMTLIKHFGHRIKDEWVFLRNQPVKMSTIRSFMWKVWSYTIAHWEKALKFIYMYTQQLQNDTLIMKKPSNALFNRWWNYVDDYLKPKYLNIWMKKSKTGLIRRKRIDPSLKKYLKNYRYFKNRLKNHQTIKKWTKRKAYQLKNLIDYSNEVFKNQQIFDLAPPKTHKIQYHRLRQQYVDKAMFFKILDTLSASSLIKRHIFLQKRGVMEEGQLWGIEVFYKDYLYIPKFILDQEQGQIQGMILNQKSQRQAQVEGGKFVTYISDPNSKMIKQWRFNLQKTGIIYENKELEKEYLKVMGKSVEDNDLQKYLSQLQLQLVGEKIHEEPNLELKIKKTKKMTLIQAQRMIQELEEDYKRVRELQKKWALNIYQILRDRQRRIQAIHQMKPLGKPIKEIVQLQIKMQDLPKDWQKALESQLSVNPDKFQSDLVILCQKCQKHLLQYQEQTVLRCSVCQGLFHHNCFHPFGCQYGRISWINYYYPLDQPPLINTQGFQKAKKLLNFRSYTDSQFQVVRKWTQMNKNVIWQRGIYTRRNIYYKGYKFYPNMNASLKLMQDSDQQLLEKWQNEEYSSPVVIDQFDKKGLGVRAMMQIKKGEFICTYSGDIVSRSLKKDSQYIFQLSYGPRALQDFEIWPQKHWSLGNFLNHSQQKKANVSSGQVLTKKGVVIILYAKKAIKMGDQLTYCYNGKEIGYNTKGFM